MLVMPLRRASASCLLGHLLEAAHKHETRWRKPILLNEQKAKRL